MAGKDIVKNPVPRAQGVKSQNKFILSFSDLTPASSMPSDLIRGSWNDGGGSGNDGGGSGQAPNPDLYIVVIVRLDPRIKCGAGSESRFIYCCHCPA